MPPAPSWKHRALHTRKVCRMDELSEFPNEKLHERVLFPSPLLLVCLGTSLLPSWALSMPSGL